MLPGGTAAWPLVARAQQPAMPVIGFGVIQLAERPKAALRQGLAEQGFVEGRNIAIEFRFTEGRYDRMPGMAAELVRRCQRAPRRHFVRARHRPHDGGY
jgi:putative ABC transport system substrate-binding protein